MSRLLSERRAHALAEAGTAPAAFRAADVVRHHTGDRAIAGIDLGRLSDYERVFND
ncbi:MAG TPA: hypothetical protein VEK15_07145 [Vicinamibacteria bacterium]|nr:hypothetical protein [Vicinamibacteria bacterium]